MLHHRFRTQLSRTYGNSHLIQQSAQKKKDALERFSLEKQEGQQDTKYTKDGVVHSIAQNNAACTASWTNGLNMASIMGDVTEEELEQMIDSIYT